MVTHYTDCFWLLDAILKYATTPGATPPFTASNKIRPLPLSTPRHLEGMSVMYFDLCMYNLMSYNLSLGNRLHYYSHVLDPKDPTHFRRLPSCPQMRWAMPHPLNSSAVGNMFRHRSSSSSLLGGRASDGLNRNLKAHGGLGSLGEEVGESPSNYWLLGISGVGIGVAWLLCQCRRPRPRGRTLLSKLPVV